MKPTKIYVNGTIVNSDYKDSYEYYGYEAFSPADLINQLPTDNSPIEIIISSGGGHVEAGNQIYSHLKAYEGEVTTKIYSLAASSASIIAMAGDKIKIAPTAQIMIHNVHGGSEGDYRVHEKEAFTLKAFNKAIANAYVLKTGKSVEDVLAMMEEETWLNAQEAVQMGFADEILFKEKTQLVASSGIVLPNDVINKAKTLIAKKEGEQMKQRMNEDTDREQASNDKDEIIRVLSEKIDEILAYFKEDKDDDRYEERDRGREETRQREQEQQTNKSRRIRYI